MMNWTDKYIGIPFVSKGRTELGCDCYGLVRLILAVECGIMLNEYANGYSEANNVLDVQEAIRSNLAVVKPIQAEELQEFDIVLFKFKGAVCHMGIVVDPNTKRFIHVMRGRDTHTASLDQLLYRRRIEGFYRA